MEQPIMQRALGSGWERLGSTVQQHYILHPGKSERRIMVGRMEVRQARWARPLLLLGRLFGALVSGSGNGIPVRVVNATLENSPALHWHRTFDFPGKPPQLFLSRMEYLQGNEIIEYVRWGLGIRMRLSEHEGALVYDSVGYQWKLGFAQLRIPDGWVLGKARIREWAIDERRFAMTFEIKHPLFGRAFAYRGEFQLLF